MSSTTPSATRNSASLDKLQVEKGRSWSTGRDRAIFLISRRSGRVNFGGRPPEYLAANESNPSALKLWMTSLTRSSEVKAILAMAGTSILWADQSTIWALRHRTTEPDPRRTIERSFRPSSLVMSRTATRSAMALLCATRRQSGGRAPPTLPVTALVQGRGGVPVPTGQTGNGSQQLGLVNAVNSASRMALAPGALRPRLKPAASLNARRRNRPQRRSPRRAT